VNTNTRGALTGRQKKEAEFCQKMAQSGGNTHYYYRDYPDFTLIFPIQLARPQFLMSLILLLKFGTTFCFTLMALALHFVLGDR
jgi:hypothetical protein